ncbi:ATPase [Streptomyces sp. NBRC 14336]|uniref:ATP-binding protein n=1 Tax=Streptomyces fuscus TaxID=3048495 RepID=A0ABT7IRI0_9ACTN|nr:MULTISPECIES: ATP-binding protein [Streptomyces]MCM1977258.1 ATP-binding protein [Streptomyces sp. G1]MDL2075181.1 ATP-binding protein [Streptomyces fuscus]GLW47038.1 ATPase [Streptomyces sp. NBRC 14336]SBT90779.1 Anti-sigma regulatory factor (Ser/Thr protein kinase) [Streptomyces sp. DI166]
MTTGLETLPWRHVLTLPTEPSAVRIARQTAELVLIEWGIGVRHPTADPALLILSELVTNSVRHAAELSPTLTVVYAAGPDCLVLAVHDRHPYRPSLCGPLPEDGRGLGTVRELVRTLGGTAVVRADPDGRGKSVWITLPL